MLGSTIVPQDPPRSLPMPEEPLAEHRSPVEPTPRRHPRRPRLVAAGSLVAVAAAAIVVAAGAASDTVVGTEAQAADTRLGAALAQPLQRDDVGSLVNLTRAALDRSVGPGTDRDSRRAIVTRERLLRAIGSVLRNPRSPDAKLLPELQREADLARRRLGSRAADGFARFDTRELIRLSARRRGDG